MASRVLHSVAAQALLELSANSSLSMSLDSRVKNPVYTKPNLTVEQLLALYESPRNKAQLPMFASGSNSRDRNHNNANKSQSGTKEQNVKQATSPITKPAVPHSAQSNLNKLLMSSTKSLSSQKSNFNTPVENAGAKHPSGVGNYRSSVKRPSSDDFPLDLSVKKSKSFDDSVSERKKLFFEKFRTSHDEPLLRSDFSVKAPPPRSSGTFLTLQAQNSVDTGCLLSINSKKNSQASLASTSRGTTSSKPNDVMKPTTADYLYGKFKFNRANKMKRRNGELSADPTPERSRDSKPQSNDVAAPFVKLSSQLRDSHLPMRKDFQIEQMLAEIKRTRCSNAVSASHLPSKQRFHHTPPRVSPDLNDENRLLRHKEELSDPHRLEKLAPHSGVVEASKRSRTCSSVEQKSAFTKYSSSCSPERIPPTASREAYPDHWSLLRNKVRSKDLMQNQSKPTSSNARGSPGLAYDAKELFSCLGDWSFVEAGKVPAFGIPPLTKNCRKTFVFDSLRSVSTKYDEKYVSAKTKDILKQASVIAKRNSSLAKPPLSARICHVNDAKHGCPGCEQKFDEIPPIIDGFWQLKKFNRYTNSTRPNSPGVVYCSQLKSSVASPNARNRSRPSSIGQVSPRTSCLGERSQSEVRMLLAPNSLNPIDIAGVINKELRRLSKQDAVDHDEVGNDDDDDDDLLANNIEESSDEEEDQANKTKTKFHKNDAKHVSSQRNSLTEQLERKRNSIQTSSILSTSSNFLKPTHNNLIQLILAQVIAREREEEVKEMHLSDLEISDDDESERSI